MPVSINGQQCISFDSKTLPPQDFELEATTFFRYRDRKLPNSKMFCKFLLRKKVFGKKFASLEVKRCNLESRLVCLVGWRTCGYTAQSHKLSFLRDLKAPRVWIFDNNDMPWYRKEPKRQMSQKEPMTADSQTWPKKRSFPGTTGSGSRTTSPTLATSATTPTGTTWSWRWAWQVGHPNYPN